MEEFILHLQKHKGSLGGGGVGWGGGNSKSVKKESYKSLIHLYT